MKKHYMYIYLPVYVGSCRFETNTVYLLLGPGCYYQGGRCTCEGRLNLHLSPIEAGAMEIVQDCGWNEIIESQS